MSGFDQAGLPGRHAVAEGLNGCDDPARFIAAFQQDNSVLLPSLDSALKLLDLQKVSRYSFHNSLFEKLRDNILKRITNLSQEHLGQLLSHTFSFVGVDLMQPVIIAIMQKIKSIDSAYLENIAKNPDLYKICPIDVKRQLWMQNHPLFGDAVGPLLNDYVKQKYALLQYNNTLTQKRFFELTPKERRTQSVVSQLVEMVGKSIELYNLVLQFLRTLFLRTGEIHYCSLRAEILMAFHDLNVREIRDVDPCHRFAWCIDASVREKTVDGKRQKELQMVLDKIQKGEEEVLGDLGMIACDPYCINIVATNIVHQLIKITKTETLPRASQEIVFLVRLLSLGLDAWSMISNQRFSEQPVSADILTKFLPLLMSVILEETLMVIETKLDSKASYHPSFTTDMWTMVCGSNLTMILFWYYIIHLLQGNKRKMMDVVLPEFAKNCRGLEIQEHLLNHFVTILLRNQDEFHNPSYCTLIFDKFLFLWLPQEPVLRHCLHILTVVVNQLESSCLVNLLTSTQPSQQHSEALHDVHSKLVDYAASSKVSTPSSIEQPNSLSPVVSPLMPANLIPSL